MYHDKDYVYITADGRASDKVYIYSDKMAKVLGCNDYIFGQCGGCVDELPFRKILEQSKGDPWKMMTLSKNKPYNTMFDHFGCLVATKNFGMYHVMREPHDDDKIEADPELRPGIGIIPLMPHDLPIYDGSGSLHVQGILAGVSKLTPKVVEAAIRKAYQVNHTIGGQVRTVKLRRTK